MNIIYELLAELLSRVKDMQQRVARTETRLCKLADRLELNVKGEGHDLQ
jgi:hypothetical protein